jgi:hypothetical protein
MLDYCATHPNATIRYKTSEMILNIHSDAGYLNEPKARSRAGGNFVMSSTRKKGDQQHNGPLLTLSTILKIVVSSAAEAEIGALFLNAKEGVNILKELGHPQPATPVQTENTTAHGIIRGTQEKRTLRMPILRHPNVSGTALYQPKMHDTCAQMLKKATRTHHWTNPRTCASPLVSSHKK